LQKSKAFSIRKTEEMIMNTRTKKKPASPLDGAGFFVRAIGSPIYAKVRNAS
jgi:hypothetical protein